MITPDADVLLPQITKFQRILPPCIIVNVTDKVLTEIATEAISIVAPSTLHVVITRSAVKQIIAVVAINAVIPCSAFQLIIAGITLHFVIACVGVDIGFIISKADIIVATPDYGQEISSARFRQKCGSGV